MLESHDCALHHLVARLLTIACVLGCSIDAEAGINALKEAHEATETALRDTVESKERQATIQKAKEKQLSEARKQYNELVKREDEEVEKAKNVLPDLGRYLLSKSRHLSAWHNKRWKRVTRCTLSKVILTTAGHLTNSPFTSALYYEIGALGGSTLSV